MIESSGMVIKKSEIGDWKHSVENLGYAIVRFGIWNLVIVSLRNKKKSHVITTNDFQKTNYLKTNLLKQIKKISSYSSRNHASNI